MTGTGFLSAGDAEWHNAVLEAVSDLRSCRFRGIRRGRLTLSESPHGGQRVPPRRWGHEDSASVPSHHNRRRPEISAIQGAEDTSSGSQPSRLRIFPAALCGDTRAPDSGER